MLSRSYHAGMEAPSTSAPAAPVASCMDTTLEYLLLETIRYYATLADQVAAVHAVETMGFRIGSQLAERCVQIGNVQRPAHAASKPILSSSTLCAHTVRVARAQALHPPRPCMSSETACRIPGLNWLATERKAVMCRLTEGEDCMAEPLVKMRFICRQFWSALFGRQVGGLKTNHRVRSAHPQHGTAPMRFLTRRPCEGCSVRDQACCARACFTQDSSEHRARV